MLLINPWVNYCATIRKYPIVCHAYLAGLKSGTYRNDNAALFKSLLKVMHLVLHAKEV